MILSRDHLVRYPECLHLAPQGDSCTRCALQAEMDGYALQEGEDWSKVVDWPLGGVLLDVSRFRGWWCDNPNLHVQRLDGGALLIRLNNRVGEVVQPPEWERGYQLAGEDGTYPTWWPTLNLAMVGLWIRQRIRNLPRRGRCWLASDKAGGASTRYSRIKTPRSFAAHFGYSAQGGSQRRSMSGHRVSFMAFHGWVPETVDHVKPTCKSVLCVRPGHLEGVTEAENQARADKNPPRYWRQRP